MAKDYLTIISACEAYLDRYGDNYLGVGWTKRADDADTRYRVMLEVIRQEAGSAVSLLDFGCGASHLYEYIHRRGLTHLTYSGLDLSPKFLQLSRGKFPTIDYYDTDILDDQSTLPTFDYIILNGIFNSKCSLSFDQMFEYFQNVITKAFERARYGIAFNVMSKQVDWERDDLFHLPFDMLAVFLSRKISRHFTIRHDYGLFEYTTYVYRMPNQDASDESSTSVMGGAP